nr:ATP synthase F0 subunit 8 [Lardoglyphus konoi]
MLPQIMPLPWLSVFFMIFLSFFSVSLFISSLFYTKFSLGSKKIMIKPVKLFW